jgi:hypothetical protein
MLVFLFFSDAPVTVAASPQNVREDSSSTRTSKLATRQTMCGADRHGHMARGGHGLYKVSPGPAMPDPSKPAGNPLLKQPYGHFTGGPQGGQRVADLYPFGHPHHRSMLIVHLGYSVIGLASLNFLAFKCIVFVSLCSCQT